MWRTKNVTGGPLDVSVTSANASHDYLMIYFDDSVRSDSLVPGKTCYLHAGLQKVGFVVISHGRYTQ